MCPPNPCEDGKTPLGDWDVKSPGLDVAEGVCRQVLAQAATFSQAALHVPG
jgi:hypothetical protein